jgi:glucose-1-phosphate adenylyltransferase
MNKKLKINAYIYDGYYCNLTSVMSYYKHSMDLLKREVRGDLFDRSRPIKTKVRDEASTYYGPGSEVRDSVVADGCYIEGKVENSVLFRGVTIEKDASVSNCILFQDTKIQSGAVLRHAITDKDVRVLNGRTLMGDTAYPIAITKGAVI